MDSASLLERLVAFPTVSTASNLDLIGFVESWLSERGFRMTRMPDETGRKANLFASLGPDTGGGILLSGHTDVVPVEGQAWTSDPFRLARRGDRLFGRGTADMKGFIACSLRAADVAAKRRLVAPLRLAFSHDEETGCIGVRPMLERLRKDGIRPDLAIVGEPTSMRIATGHKSKLALRATCCGRAAHSALAPTGLNAIHLATDFVARLRTRQAAIAEGDAMDTGFEVPYTTIHVGKIAGGTVVNIVPDRCVVDFEIRSAGGDDPHRLLEAVAADAAELAVAARRRAAESDIRVELTGGYPGLAEPEDSAAVRSLAALVDDPSPIKVDFGTEAGLYREALAIPVVVCGPGSMSEGHKPDEFVTLDQLERCDRLMDRLIDRLTVNV